MKIVREHINEAFTEKNSDPIKDMGIGVFAHRDFESEDELYKFLVNIIPAIIHKEIPPVFVMSTPDGDSICMRTKYHDMIQEYMQKYITVHGIKYQSLDLKLLAKHLKTGMRISTQKEISNKDEIFLSESFEEDSDPIADLGIGAIKRFEKLIEFFKDADPNCYIYTIHVYDDFIDFYFTHPIIAKLSKGQQNKLFDYVVDAVDKLGFSSLLVNPKLSMHTNKRELEQSGKIVPIPGIVRFEILRVAQNKVKPASYRRVEPQRDHFAYYERNIVDKDQYEKDIKRFRPGLE
jgi:hypothetical protein